MIYDDIAEISLCCSSNISCIWISPPLARLHFTVFYRTLLFSTLCLDNNNRVKLLSEPGTAGSDYINASFVSVSISYQLLKADTHLLHIRGVYSGYFSVTL